VALGMLVAAQISVSRGTLAENDRQRLGELIAHLGPLPPIADIPTAQLLEAVKHDKKVIAGRLHFVLPTSIGSTAIVDDVTEREMKAALVRVGFRK
jgi:3-dehydroquinate synthase